jgi:hypothetical protein
LVRRSLVEREAGTRKLQQQAIVREYMTEKARDQLAEKGVSREKPDLLVLVKEGII